VQKRGRVGCVMTVAAVLALAPTAIARAATPQPVTMTIHESKVDDGPSSGTFVGVGGAFGSGTSGTTLGTSFSLNPRLFGFCFVPVPPPGAQEACLETRSPVSFTFTASILVSTSEGAFSLAFQGSFVFVGFTDTGYTVASSGTWRVNEGSGSYVLLQGTGTFTEQFQIDTGTNDEVGTDTFTGQLQTK
jgi:hypothetical protein